MAHAIAGEMKQFPKITNCGATMAVVDRRNHLKPQRSKFDVVETETMENGFKFLAGWQLPTPASRRYYYYGSREVTVEEIGKVPGKNLFLFSGSFV
jgi:hypothetical protein